MHLISSNMIQFKSPESLVKNSSKMVSEIKDLCLSHQQNNKWILVIDNQPIHKSVLAKQKNIDASKILHINHHKVPVSANNIETALKKGNCSAVILMSSYLKQEQLHHLTEQAKESNTTFMVLNKASGMH